MWTLYQKLGYCINFTVSISSDPSPHSPAANDAENMVWTDSQDHGEDEILHTSKTMLFHKTTRFISKILTLFRVYPQLIRSTTGRARAGHGPLWTNFPAREAAASSPTHGRSTSAVGHRRRSAFSRNSSRASTESAKPARSSISPAASSFMMFPTTLRVSRKSTENAKFPFRCVAA